MNVKCLRHRDYPSFFIPPSLSLFFFSPRMDSHHQTLRKFNQKASQSSPSYQFHVFTFVFHTYLPFFIRNTIENYFVNISKMIFVFFVDSNIEMHLFLTIAEKVHL